MIMYVFEYSDLQTKLNSLHDAWNPDLSNKPLGSKSHLYSIFIIPMSAPFRIFLRFHIHHYWWASNLLIAQNSFHTNGL